MRATSPSTGCDLQLLGAAALRAELPWLGHDVVGASLCAEDGHANPRLVGPAFARLARRLGADVREHAAVLSATRGGDGFETRTADLEVHSRYLVNCAGVGAGRIAAAFGEDVPLQPLVPNMLVTEPLPFFISRSIGVCGGGIYLRQIARGNAILGGGGGWGDAESSRSRPLTGSSLAAMANAIAIVPALAGAHVIRSWTGIDGKMPDLIPVIGWSATTPNLDPCVRLLGARLPARTGGRRDHRRAGDAGPLGLAARAVRDRSLRECGADFAADRRRHRGVNQRLPGSRGGARQI